MIKVSLIILNWNGGEDTVECLKSLENINKTNIDLRILVVDNASSDNSIEQIEKLELKNNLEIIKNKRNLGFAEGNNVGMKKAIKENYDYICLLNNDIVVDKNFLVELIKAAEKNEKAGLLSPKIYFYKGFEFHKNRYKKSELGKVIWYAGGQMDWDNVYGSNRGVDEVDKGQFNDMTESDSANGACVLMRISALKKVGLFNEKYFLYYEDSELSVRMKRKGYKVLFVPSSVVWHKVSRSSGIGSSLNDYYTTRNRLMFGLKYARFRTKLALIKESIKLLFKGRPWQSKGILDFYLGNLYQGSWKS